MAMKTRAVTGELRNIVRDRPRLFFRELQDRPRLLFRKLRDGLRQYLRAFETPRRDFSRPVP